MIEALVIVGAYLVGSIPTGVIGGRMRGFEPRTVGSGNIGTSNVARAAGMGAAAITFGGDLLKGAIPVVVARAMGFPHAAVAWVGFAAFVGSISSVFLRFRGGKGVAAGLGVWLGIAPLVILFALAAFGVVFALSRTVSIASMSAAIVLPAAGAPPGPPRAVLPAPPPVTALVLFLVF